MKKTSVKIRLLRRSGSRREGASPGFTIIELLMVVVVLAILLSLAAPDFSSFIQNNRIRSTTEDLITAIGVARTEAIKRGAAVMLCRTGSPNVSPGTLACRANDPDGNPNLVEDWTPGWIMYVKPNYTGSGGADYDNATDGDPIQVGNPAPNGVTITSNSAGNQWLTYFGDGSLNEGGAAAIFAICDSRGPSEGHLITIPAVGRPYVTQPPANCAP